MVVLGQGKVSVVDPVTGNVTSSNTDSAFADLLRGAHFVEAISDSLRDVAADT